MLQIQNFSACVTVGGKDLEEHQVEYSKDGRRATCWIASEAGKNFAVKWRDSTRIRIGTTSGRVTLDGIKSGQKTISPGRLGHQDTAERSYISTGPKSIRHFLFSNLRLTSFIVLSFGFRGLADIHMQTMTLFWTQISLANSVP